jgi:glycosyltransferase involved in cell wall biosynthesis
MNAKRYRILYVEKPVFFGGSVTGLFELVRGLDLKHYEPVVLFYGPNPSRPKFEALGIQVITLSEDLPPAATAVSRRDIAASLSRYSQVVSAGYTAARQLYLFLKKDYPLARRLAQVMKEQTIDLVHHNTDLPGNRDTILATRLAGLPQVCHVRMLHTFSFIEKALSGSVDAFIYMSTAIERLYQEQGIPAAKGHVVYDAFAANDYENLNHAPELRAELGLGERDFVITNVGRIDWWKGQEYFIEAMAHIVQDQPQAKALIVGEPDTKPVNQAYFKQLRRMVENLNLSSHVIFTGFRSDVPQVMAASNVIVHSSSEPEPFGRVVVEAMMAGRPVIATAAGGVLDIVEDRSTGLLVPLKDAQSMARAIAELLQNPQQAKIMGTRARQRARQRFSVGQHVAGVQKIYGKILAPGSLTDFPELGSMEEQGRST